MLAVTGGEATQAGCGTNSEIAQRLGVHPSQITRWRTAYVEFEDAIANGHLKAVTRANSAILQAGFDGDVASLKWWLDRRGGDAFRPSARIEHSSKEGLAELLARRISDATLQEMGVLIFDDEPAAPVPPASHQPVKQLPPARGVSGHKDPRNVPNSEEDLLDCGILVYEDE